MMHYAHLLLLAFSLLIGVVIPLLLLASRWFAPLAVSSLYGSFLTFHSMTNCNA